MTGEDIGRWIKRQASVASSVGILLGGAAAIIVFFGGSIPPWYTPAQAQTDQRAASAIQQQTVQALGKINDKLDTLSKRVYSGDCQNMRDALNQANAALAKNPNDLLAKALRDVTASRMSDIPNCPN